MTPRLVSYLEKRKLIKARKTREQALQIYNRIKAFREGKRDRYPFYMLLVGSAVISAIGASTIIIIVVLMSPEFQNMMVYLFGYPPLAAVLRSGADPSSVSTGANTVICTGARDGRCDERS